MGLTETDAKAQGIKYEKATFPWAASGRALGLGRPEGFTKLLFDPESDRLIGAGIVGVGAGDLIAETVLALEAGLNAQDIALGDPSAPDPVRDDRVRRRDAGRDDHRPAAAQEAKRS